MAASSLHPVCQYIFTSLTSFSLWPLAYDLNSFSLTKDLSTQVCLIAFFFFCFQSLNSYPIKNFLFLLPALHQKNITITVPKYVSRKTSYIPV